MSFNLKVDDLENKILLWSYIEELETSPHAAESIVLFYYYVFLLKCLSSMQLYDSTIYSYI